MLKGKLKKKFGGLKFSAIFLHQFFKGNLSRKAEGNGPVKPWQPNNSNQIVKGANSIPHTYGVEGEDKSEI